VTRIQLALRLVVAILIAGSVAAWRVQVRKADRISQALAQETMAHARTREQLVMLGEAVQAYRKQADETQARVHRAESEATKTRRSGEAQAVRILVAPASPPDTNLVRWAAQEAKGLSTRLEAQ
jgi:uncharacterized coiled-coil protein SlyX